MFKEDLTAAEVVLNRVRHELGVPKGEGIIQFAKKIVEANAKHTRSIIKLGDQLVKEGSVSVADKRDVAAYKELCIWWDDVAKVVFPQEDDWKDCTDQEILGKVKTLVFVNGQIADACRCDKNGTIGGVWDLKEKLATYERADNG